MRFRRHNIAWLSILTVPVGVALLGGGVTAPVGAALLTLYAGAVAASVVELEVRPVRLLDRSREAISSRRMSPDAREAVERARRRGSLLVGGVTLLDLGLITMQRAESGMDIRRTWSVTKDSDSVRPFITVHVAPEAAERASVVRFELIDGEGREQFIHEQRIFLRDGDMSIMADHHLPLLDNERLRAGDWDLRVSLDGILIGARSFTLTPSLSERFPHLAEERQRQLDRARRSLGDDGEARTLDGVADEPMSLEDLLRGAGERSSTAGRGTRSSRPRG